MMVVVDGLWWVLCVPGETEKSFAGGRDSTGRNAEDHPAQQTARSGAAPKADLVGLHPEDADQNVRAKRDE